MKFKRIILFILILCLFLSGCDYSNYDQKIDKDASISHNRTEKATDDTTFSSNATTTHEHIFSSATCTNPQTCTVCGVVIGSVVEHIFKNGTCTVCDMKDPNYDSEITVWIPTNGGKKYHSRSTCSNMKAPQEVTLSKAQNLGFTACKKCY